jgi:hypothetical protein
MWFLMMNYLKMKKLLLRINNQTKTLQETEANQQQRR